MTAVTQKHPYHLVDPSPWPLTASTAAFTMTTSGVMQMHGYAGGGTFFILGFALLLATKFFWWRDVVREGTHEGQHTSLVQLGLRFGMVLFIVSEVMFFVAFFWAFFWASLAPVPEIASVWPPKNIEVLAAFEVPFLNTLILLSSGATVTWAHHAVLAGEHRPVILGLICTIVLAATFTGLQVFEYVGANFTIADSVQGSTFYMATGFHGFHVFVGTCFLAVCLFRALAHHFTSRHHFGLEAAIM